MSNYKAPGVYVEEKASGSAPIAGVGTSTAGFIGMFSSALLTIPIKSTLVPNELIDDGDGTKTVFDLANAPVLTDADTYEFRVDGEPGDVKEVKNTTDANGDAIPQVEFNTAPDDKVEIRGDYYVYESETFTPIDALEVKLCTNFSEFKKFFGDFSEDSGQKELAHAVYGFFNNGGARCFVVRINADTDIDKVIGKFEAIDEIALVVAPGITGLTAWGKIDAHCRNMGDRFAIFDSDEDVESSEALDTTKLDKSVIGNILPDFSNYVSFYFPWLQIFDPVEKIKHPKGKGYIYVPPSGHVAGVYARVDTNRGVHKAPANEPVLGTVGLKYKISKAMQVGLNPQGVNCIRELNGNIRIWGARTMGGDANGEWKYINVRRLFLFLRESIDEGTQWVVFEPNSRELWAKIRRNITAFLTVVWRTGALFGNSPEEAFYVKCDDETNPPELRDLGQVVTEIGVAVVKPAEFVIFRIQQWAGPSGG